tara:strand:- start:184 stop:321 length:138 start_codon:yes stop_codon:yes gene_type:complete
MAKVKTSVKISFGKPPKKRRGQVSKKDSPNKKNKLYKKPYRGQGR